MMDISNLSLPELRDLLEKVEAEIQLRTESAKKDLLQRMQQLAQEHGLNLTDVITQELTEPPAAAGKKTAKSAKAAKPASALKFRNPANPSIGWTGHGRKPQWVIDWLAEGKALDDLRAPETTPV